MSSDLQLDPLSICLHRLDLEINANRRNESGAEGIVGISEKKTRLANACNREETAGPPVVLEGGATLAASALLPLFPIVSSLICISYPPFAAILTLGGCGLAALTAQRGRTWS